MIALVPGHCILVTCAIVCLLSHSSIKMGVQRSL